MKFVIIVLLLSAIVWGVNILSQHDKQPSQYCKKPVGDLTYEQQDECQSIRLNQRLRAIQESASQVNKK